MGKENKIILGIALIFTLITSAFSLLGRLSIVFVDDTLKEGLNKFFLRNSLWIIVVAGIMIVLFWVNKKNNQGIFDMLMDRTIRITSGILVLVVGVINLASSLPNSLLSIKSALEITKQIGDKVDGIVLKSIAANSISLFIILCQISFGIYLSRYFKSKIDTTGR